MQGKKICDQKVLSCPTKLRCKTFDAHQKVQGKNTQSKNRELRFNEVIRHGFFLSQLIDRRQSLNILSINEMNNLYKIAMNENMWPVVSPTVSIYVYHLWPSVSSKFPQSPVSHLQSKNHHKLCPRV